MSGVWIFYLIQNIAQNEIIVIVQLECKAIQVVYEYIVYQSSILKKRVIWLHINILFVFSTGVHWIDTYMSFLELLKKLLWKKEMRIYLDTSGRG